MTPSEAAEATAGPVAGSRRRIVGGGAWNTAVWIVTNTCGAFNTIILVRSMTHSQYGVFVMATSTMAIISAVAGFGLAQALIQLAPSAGSDGARVVVRHALVASSVIAAVVAALTGTACLALGAGPYEELAATLAIMLPIVAVAPFVASLTGFLQAVHQPRRLAKTLLVPPVLLTATVLVLCLTSHPRATWVAVARAGAILVTLGLLLAAFHRAGGFKRAGPVTGLETQVRLRRVLILGASLLGGSLTAILLAQLDVIILGFARGRDTVALYGPASQIADNALSMAATVGTFYIATIARVLTRQDFAEAGDLYRWASRWTFVWASPVLAVMFACPVALLALLFGRDYAAMATPLRLLGAGVLVNLLFGFNGLTVDSLNIVKVILGRQAIALAVNIAACAALIPAFGADGAAAATACSLVAMNLVASVLLHRKTRIAPSNPRLFAVAAAFAAAVGVGLLLDGLVMTNALRIAAVGAITGALCALVGYVVSSRTERTAIRTGVVRHLTRIAPHFHSHPAA